MERFERVLQGRTLSKAESIRLIKLILMRTPEDLRPELRKLIE